MCSFILSLEWNHMCRIKTKTTKRMWTTYIFFRRNVWFHFLNIHLRVILGLMTIICYWSIIHSNMRHKCNSQQQRKTTLWRELCPLGLQGQQLLAEQGYQIYRLHFEIFRRYYTVLARYKEKNSRKRKKEPVIDGDGEINKRRCTSCLTHLHRHVCTLKWFLKWEWLPKVLTPLGTRTQCCLHLISQSIS